MYNPHLFPAAAVWCQGGPESGAKPANLFQAAKCEWRWRRVEPGESERPRRCRPVGRRRWRNAQLGRAGEGGESWRPPQGLRLGLASWPGGRLGQAGRGRGKTRALVFPKYLRPHLGHFPQCQPLNPEMAAAWIFQEKSWRDGDKAISEKWNCPCIQVSL